MEHLRALGVLHVPRRHDSHRRGPWARRPRRRGLRRRGGLRARSQCRFVLLPIHFIPESLTSSIPLFLKRQCDQTLGGLGRRLPLRGRRCAGRAGLPARNENCTGLARNPVQFSFASPPRPPPRAVRRPEARVCSAAGSRQPEGGLARAGREPREADVDHRGPLVGLPPPQLLRRDPALVRAAGPAALWPRQPVPIGRA